MKILSFSLLFIMATVPVFSQGYEITVNLKSRNDTVILGYFFTKRDKMYAADTVVLKKGKGVFRGSKKLENGVYFLMSDGRKLFDFIVGDNKKFGIVADSTDFVNLTKFTSSPDNDVFLEFLRYHTDRGKQFYQLSEQFQSATSDADKNDIRAKQQALVKERNQFIEKLADAHKDLYVSKWLRTLVPPETHIPDPPRDDEGNIIDQNFRYHWWRAHFFDNFNIYDPDMLRTESYEEKLFDYLTKVIPQHTDTICAEVDKILTKAQANDDVFRFVLREVFNHYYTSKDIVRGYVVPENVWMYLAEKWYIPFAKWSTDEFIDFLKKEVPKRKPNLIGKQAPPLENLTVLPPEHFKAAALDTAIKFDVYAGRIIQDFRKEKEFESKFTVIYFWEYSCGHCQKGIRELFNIWQELKDKGLQVITVQVHFASREDKGKWINFVNEHELFGWTNAWSPYTYKYKELYNVANVPVMYLLDENFNIIIRNIVAEQLKEFFDNQKNRNQL